MLDGFHAPLPTYVDSRCRFSLPDFSSIWPQLAWPHNNIALDDQKRQNAWSANTHDLGWPNFWLSTCTQPTTVESDELIIDKIKSALTINSSLPQPRDFTDFWDMLCGRAAGLNGLMLSVLIYLPCSRKQILQYYSATGLHHHILHTIVSVIPSKARAGSLYQPWLYLAPLRYWLDIAATSQNDLGGWILLDSTVAAVSCWCFPRHRHFHVFIRWSPNVTCREICLSTCPSLDTSQWHDDSGGSTETATLAYLRKPLEVRFFSMSCCIY